MKELCVLLCLSVFLGSCADLPKIRRVTAPDIQDLRTGCCNVFPSGKWRFVHSIEAKLPGGGQGFMLGVTVISEDARTIDCAIMSVEGFVFFEACMNKDLTINRAIYPFDNPAFAEGLIRDIQLIFFKPSAQSSEYGVLKNELPLCRYHTIDGGVVDVITAPDHSWEIQQYGKDQKLTRTVKAAPSEETGSESKTRIPKRLELVANGPHAYELTMELVEAERLSP
jgi:hypothetical protein